MNYLYETHFHTMEVSRCGEVSAKDGVAAYKAAGYSGIVVTDHIAMDYFKNVYPGKNWQEKVEYYLNGYRQAKKYADENFAVILGMEIRFDNDNGNDYLVFGLDEEFFYKNEWFFDTSVKKFKRVCEENNLTIIQAHPFRINSVLTNPRYIDGVEVFNGNRRHDSSNNMAELWAKKHSFIATSGSDFHEPEDLARGGIYLSEFVTDAKQLRAAILSGKYELKKP